MRKRSDGFGQDGAVGHNARTSEGHGRAARVIAGAALGLRPSKSMSGFLGSAVRQSPAALNYVEMRLCASTTLPIHDGRHHDLTINSYESDTDNSDPSENSQKFAPSHGRHRGGRGRGDGTFTLRRHLKPASEEAMSIGCGLRGRLGSDGWLPWAASR